MSESPFAVLGVAETASLDELAAARRRLAQRHHPDLGGDAGAMQRVNAAYDAAVKVIAAGPPHTEAVVPPPPPTAGAPAGRSSRRRQPQRRGVQYDTPSFTVDVLPAETFEALLVVTSWIGEVVNDDPPYVLEVLLHEPLVCFCRLDLVPDAGGTTISLAVAPADGEPAPDIDDVRDLWIACLNEPLG
jgi:hypothetical protein